MYKLILSWEHHNTYTMGHQDPKKSPHAIFGIKKQKRRELDQIVEQKVISHSFKVQKVKRIKFLAFSNSSHFRKSILSFFSVFRIKFLSLYAWSFLQNAESLKNQISCIINLMKQQKIGQKVFRIKFLAFSLRKPNLEIT